MTQAGFFDDELARTNVRSTDPDTSWEAAFAHLTVRSHDRREALRQLYYAYDGMTDFELGDCMGRQQTSAGKRRGELRDVGLVENSGRRRPAPSGSGAIVWVITSKGRIVHQTLVTQEQDTSNGWGRVV